MKSYSSYQFTFFRIILGVYLCIHFGQLIPFASEIWSNQGILQNPNSNLIYSIFPNLLGWLSSPIEVTIFVTIIFAVSILFLIGFQRQLMALLIWYGWVCLFDRNNLINNSATPYVGWLLLCCAAVPKGEPLSFSKIKEGAKWEFPIVLFIGAWALMAVGYTISGIDKLMSPSWKDGSTIFHLLENPLARNWWLRELFLKLPESLLKLNSWIILSLEIIFLPFAIIKVTRKWIWLAMIFMHLEILLIVDFADLTFGMLMIHWFTFDSRWLTSKPQKSGIIYFDGLCGICNGFVDFMMPKDYNEVLQYAPLQGETAKQNLKTHYLNDLNTIVYQTKGKTFTKSTAVLKAISSIGGIWKLVLVFLVVPKFIRDYIYSFVAAHRFKWSVKKETCRMPTPEERNKILM